MAQLSEYRRRLPREMSDVERAEVMARLRRRGWTYGRIGKVVGLSANGVKYSLQRALGQQYEELCEEELPDLGARPKEW